MVVRRIKIVIVFLICFLLQGNAVYVLSVFGGVPDLLLVLLLVYTFLDDTPSYDGLIAATAAGFLRDTCYGLIIGPTPLMYLAVGGIMYYMKRRLNNENGIILFVVTTVATVLSTLGRWLLCVIFTQSWMSFSEVLIRLPGSLFWNFIILLIIHSVMNRRRRRSRMMF